MLQNINFHIWFKVARPIKRKYRLSTNCVLVLNCAYLIHEYTKKSFTLRGLQRYADYYNSEKIKSYVKILVDNGYILQSGVINSYLLYSLSAKGLQVIKELNESYENEISLFCNTYNIVL